MQSSKPILSSGWPTCQPGMGSATCMMQIGPAPRHGVVHQCQQQGLWVFLSWLMVSGYLPPAGIQGPTDEPSTGMSFMQSPWLWLLWGPHLKGRCLLLHCDNASVVHIMAKASTHSKTMMALVQTFTLLSIQHNVHVHIQHIAGVNKEIADAVSRFEMDRFQQLHAEAEPLPEVNIW